MVQLPEKTDEKSEAFKAGYKNICEIGKERIRRAGKKIKAQLMAEGKETRDIAEKKAQGNAVAVSKAYWIDSPEYKSANKQMASDLDTGFRVLKLDSTNMKDVYYNPAEITIDTIMGTVDNIILCQNSSSYCIIHIVVDICKLIGNADNLPFQSMRMS